MEIASHIIPNHFHVSDSQQLMMILNEKKKSELKF